MVDPDTRLVRLGAVTGSKDDPCRVSLLAGVRIAGALTGLFIGLAPISLQAQGQDRELQELLDMGLEELGEIPVTTASKHAEPVVDAPATVRVITGEQIRERGYMTLEDALADLPGMQFRDTMGMNSYVFIRGVPNQNNLALVLVDGVEINELNSGGFYGGGHYNLANVERIEVVYGPTSALYGTNAVSGVINIVTKDPKDSPGLVVGGGVGSYRTGLVDLQYAHYDSETRFGLRVSGWLKTTRHADLAGANNDNTWSPDLELFEDDRALDIKLRFLDFVVGVNYQNRVSSSATYHRSVGTPYQDHGTRWDIRFANAYVRHRVTLADDVVLQSEVYAREATVADDSVFEITDAGQIAYFRPNHLVGAEVLLDAELFSDLGLIGGLALEYDWLAEAFATSESRSPDERPPRPSAPDLTSSTLFTTYLQAQYRLLEYLQFTAGLHYDHSSVYHDVLIPRVGMVATWQSLVGKLLYGEAFRAPRPWDYTDGSGNPDLDPERMRSVELALGYLWRDALRVEVAFYRNRLEDVLEKEAVSADQWRWINGGRVDTVGAEVGAELRGGPFRSFVNFTYTRSRDETGARVPEVALRSGNAGVGCHFTDSVRLEAWGRYTGARLNPKQIEATGRRRIEPAFVANASLSFLNQGGFDFQVIARNVLDEEYYHPSNLEPDRYRQPQRTVFVKAAYRL